MKSQCNFEVDGRLDRVKMERLNCLILLCRSANIATKAVCLDEQPVGELNPCFQVENLMSLPLDERAMKIIQYL